MPDSLSRRTSRIALWIAVLCFAAEAALHFSRVAADASEGVQTEKSRMVYVGPWKATRAGESGKPPVYFAGESVVFDTVRQVTFDGRKDLPILVASSLYNVETDFAYGLQPVARVLTKEGKYKLQTVRVIPPSAIPGRYKVSGWAKTETERRPTFAAFDSEEIEVVNALPK